MGKVRVGEASHQSGRVQGGRSRLIASALGVGLILGSAQAVAANAPNPPATNPIQEQVRKLGLKTCAGMFTALGESLTHGSAYMLSGKADSKRPDGHAVQGIAGMTYNTPDLKGPAAGIVFAAPMAGGCEGNLVRVAPFQKACPQIVGFLPAGSTLAGNLSGVPLYNLGGNQGQALMIASGPTCVVVTIAQAVDAK